MLLGGEPLSGAALGAGWQGGIRIAIYGVLGCGHCLLRHWYAANRMLLRGVPHSGAAWDAG